MNIDDPITARVKQKIRQYLEKGERVPKRLVLLIAPEEYYLIEKAVKK